jgi:hypothetical protein
MEIKWVENLYLSVSRKESRKVRTGVGDNEHKCLFLFARQEFTGQFFQSKVDLKQRLSRKSWG